MEIQKEKTEVYVEGETNPEYYEDILDYAEEKLENGGLKSVLEPKIVNSEGVVVYSGKLPESMWG